MTGGTEHEFSPDWTIAPAATLQEWMSEHGLNAGELARRCARGETDFRAALLIRDVLGREPLGECHAQVLERATGVSAQLWLGLERLYRDDLAAGRTDTTAGAGRPQS